MQPPVQTAVAVLWLFLSSQETPVTFVGSLLLSTVWHEPLPEPVEADSSVPLSQLTLIDAFIAPADPEAPSCSPRQARSNG